MMYSKFWRYLPFLMLLAGSIFTTGCAPPTPEAAGHDTQQQFVSSDAPESKVAAASSDEPTPDPVEKKKPPATKETVAPPVPAAKTNPDIDENGWSTIQFKNINTSEASDPALERRWGKMPYYRKSSSWTPGVLSESPALPRDFGLALTDKSVTDLCLLELQKHAPRIVHLSLRGSNVTNLGARQLKSLRNLRSLDISGTKMDSASLLHLPAPEKLLYLTLEAKVDDKFVRDIAELNNLKEITVVAPSVAMDAFDKLTSLPGLERLDVQSKGFSQLQALARLNRLHLLSTANGAGGVPARTGKEVVSVALTLLKRDVRKFPELSLASHFPNVQEIDLRISPKVAIPTQLLQGLSDLRRLSIDTAEDGNPDLVYTLPIAHINLTKECLRGTGNIRDLSLTGRGMSLEALPDLKQLKTLSINAIISIDSQFMSNVAQSKAIEHFRFRYSVPYKFQYENRKRGSGGDFHLLAEMPELRTIDLVDSDLKRRRPDEGHSTLILPKTLEALGKLEHLETLNVYPFHLGDKKRENGESYGVHFLRNANSLKSTNIHWLLTIEDENQLAAIDRLHLMRHARRKESIAQVRARTFKAILKSSESDDDATGLNLSKERLTNLKIEMDPGQLLEAGDVSEVEWINLNGNDCDDSIFVRLLEIPKLVFVSITGTRTTLPGIRQFLHYKKNCCVLHEKLRSPLDSTSLRHALRCGVLDRTRTLHFAKFDKSAVGLLHKKMLQDMQFIKDKTLIALHLSEVKNVDTVLGDIIPIANFVHLLNLSGSDLTPAGLKKLEDAVTGFARIDVSNTEITRAQVDEFQKSRRRRPYAKRRTVILWEK